MKRGTRPWRGTGMKRSDPAILNYRLAVEPVAHRKELMRELTPEEVMFVRDVRLVHNALGTWANAMLIKGATIEQVKTIVNNMNEEIQKL